MEGKLYLISEAAKEIHVENHVLRYWEEELALPVKRNAQGHRYYTEEDVATLKKIKRLKEQGLQLKAIRLFLTKDGEIIRKIPKGQEIVKNEGEVPCAGEDIVSGVDKNAVEAKENVETGKSMKGKEIVETGNDGKAKDIVGTGKVVKARDLVETGSTMKTRAVPEDENAMEVTYPVEKKNVADDKIKKLQLILKLMVEEALREYNEELKEDLKADLKDGLAGGIADNLKEELMDGFSSGISLGVKEAVVKELDYQFRMQEEREEQRELERKEKEDGFFERLEKLLQNKKTGSGNKKTANAIDKKLEDTLEDEESGAEENILQAVKRKLSFL